MFLLLLTWLQSDGILNDWAKDLPMTAVALGVVMLMRRGCEKDMDRQADLFLTVLEALTPEERKQVVANARERFGTRRNKRGQLGG